jgi:hypothetical protein
MGKQADAEIIDAETSGPVPDAQKLKLRVDAVVDSLIARFER